MPLPAQPGGLRAFSPRGSMLSVGSVDFRQLRFPLGLGLHLAHLSTVSGKLVYVTAIIRSSERVLVPTVVDCVKRLRIVLLPLVLSIFRLRQCQSGLIPTTIRTKTFQFICTFNLSRGRLTRTYPDGKLLFMKSPSSVSRPCELCHVLYVVRFPFIRNRRAADMRAAIYSTASMSSKQSVPVCLRDSHFSILCS